MRLDATNDSVVRQFIEYVRGQLDWPNATETEPISLKDIERPTFCWCGRMVRLSVESGGFRVVCVHCFRRGPMAKTGWVALKLWNGGVRAPALTSRNAAEQIVDYYFESAAATDRRIVADRLAAIIFQCLNPAPTPQT